MVGKVATWLVNYAAVILAISIGFLAVLPDIRARLGLDVLNAILIILVLLATAQLSERFTVLRSTESTVRNLQEESRASSSQLLTGVRELDQLARGQVRATDFFGAEILDRNPQPRIASCDNLAISGIHLLRTTHTLWPFLRSCMSQGTQARILLLNPDNKAAVTATAFRFERHQIPSRLRREVRLALANWASLAEEVPEGAVAVRLLNVMPPFGIWMLDDGTDRAEMMVEVYAFRNNEPTFALRYDRDPQWYTFFRTQFEEMWTAGIPWDKEAASGHHPRP